ncbi:MAG: dihydroorotase [Deltaproteobacteria bacterium RIFCSPLOWO2_02_FULL_44_10]|nr:MAG: dihydroorotase [Deltaproteobacteria bacterium RIFCSPHIGHO2_02_FULL_44_16]OGQ46580.1 MAG: dihydroorotase [Deltaproteobacteria bacterium RIFCSPLOWO2_02_FULL_44_10]
MTTVVIQNGLVLDPSQKLRKKMNVILRQGKIAALTDSKKFPADAVVYDVKNAVVAPGFIDPHVHFRDPGFEYKEDIASGSRAAAAGGFTLVCCMANTYPVNDSASVSEYILTRSREVGLITVLPIGAVSRGLKGEQLADIGDMAKLGVIALSDDGKPIMNSSLMRRAMEYAKPFGLPIISHAEDISLGKGVMNEGRVSTELGLKGIPHASEDIMIARDILLSELTGAHLHVAHLSSARSVEMIRYAKKRGDHVTCEVTPHHLVLTDEAVRGYDPNTKMHPPLRTEEDRLALIEGLKDGTIDMIATDHAPHALTDKEVGFDLASNGIVGLETSLPLSLTLVHEKKISLERLVDAMSCKPASVFGLEGKGTLKVGSDADITIFDPDRRHVIDVSTFASKSRNTPFDGWKLKGKVLHTICGGRVVYSSKTSI